MLASVALDKETNTDGDAEVPPAMLKKRSILIAGHATSVSLEPQFWDALKAIADSRGQSINQMVAAIDLSREGNLSSAIRVFVLEYLQKKTPGGMSAGGE